MLLQLYNPILKIISKQIPNFITSLNIVMGTLATIFAIDGHLVLAGIFIVIASVLDFLDGLAARVLNAYSEIGKQLDSLADIVSFGVAPGAILFTLLEFSMFEDNLPIYEIAASWQQWLILFSSFLIPVFGAIRLARFNANTTGESFFRGLPIPANGIFWAAMGLILEVPKYHEYLQVIYSTQNLLILGIFMSGMMVISMPMFSFKISSFDLKNNWYRYLLIIISIALFAIMNVYSIPLIIFTYILINLGLYLLKIDF